MRIALEFYTSEVLSADDLDELTDLIHQAIEEKVGAVDYTIQDTRITLELDDA